MDERQATSAVGGTVAAVAVEAGEVVAAGALLVAVELMKMEHPVRAEVPGRVVAVHVAVGDQVEAGDAVVALADVAGDEVRPDDVVADGAERADLAAVRARHALLADEARPEAVAARRERGLRTARENVADLLDEGSLVEYGGLAIAAQRHRRDLDELLARSPADGMVTGVGTVGGLSVAVAAYDATVFAGTQGLVNHRKTDRLLRLALDRALPLVLYAEGGGARASDDYPGASLLDVPTFTMFARLASRVPTVAVVAGWCFAGNAALAAAADVVVAVEGASYAMAGPAMVEGGGLGVHDPEALGPVEMHAGLGSVDVLVEDEAAATDVARRFLRLAVGGRREDATHGDHASLRAAVPEDRRRVYDVGAVLDGLVDVGSLLELRRAAAPGMRTALATLHGRPVGLLANDPTHLGGAIDAEGARSAARHLRLCDDLGLPVVVLCDTPGFMVGPRAEEEGGARAFGDLYRVGASLRVPVLGVVTRKAYGLGAMAMLGGDLTVPDVLLAWPTAELGPMGLEGAVRLGHRRELAAIEDAEERAAREQELVDAMYATAAGLNVAAHGELDDVVDPADTADRLAAVLDLGG